MANPSLEPPQQQELHTRLGLNRSTVALLIAILLIGMGQELWAPFMPKYIQQSIHDFLSNHSLNLGLTSSAVVVLAVGLYGTWKDVQEGVYYYLGGRIGGTLGTRKALIVFAIMPLIGYAMLLSAFTPLLATIMAFASLPFITGYDSISQPSTLRVVGDSLKAQHRTMAFSLQSIQRRISRVAAYLTGGALVFAFGSVLGVKVGVALSVALVAIAVFVQVRLLHVDTKDSAARTAGFSWKLIRRFPPELRRLLMADIFARIAEGMPRELFVLAAVVANAKENAAEGTGLAIFDVNAQMWGVLLAIQAMTSMAIYVPIAWLASKPGAQKKPFIGLTFLFFALFPVSFWALGSLWGAAGLVIAFVIGGLRELGEPARKAMITELLPPDAQTAATGLYWAVRTFAVMLAPLVGALIWIFAGPAAVFITASALGFCGAVFFALLFNRNHTAEPAL